MPERLSILFSPGTAEYRAERERLKKALAANRIPVTLRSAATWEAEKGVMQFSFKADDDSFFVSAYAGEYPRRNSRCGTILKPTAWHTGVTKSQWQWRQFMTELTLPAGPVVLTLHSREDGTKIDRLFLTADPLQEP